MVSVLFLLAFGIRAPIELGPLAGQEGVAERNGITVGTLISSPLPPLKTPLPFHIGLSIGIMGGELLH